MNYINFAVSGAFSDPYAAPPPAGYPTKDGAAGPEALGTVATESRGAFSDPYAAPPPAGYPTKDGAAGPEALGTVATESRDSMNNEVMEKKLYDACLEGDVETLEILIKGDKLTLARVSLSSFFNQLTPLHLASMLGHFEFVKSLLSFKPDFARNLDLQGRSALFASANGYPSIVKLLMEYDENMCRVCDEDGRTPLHLAVFKGQDECVTELLKVDSESDQERTMLQLCIKYNV
ncbi:hypothetical protein ACET3Z_012853 [Daucus carota]